MARYRWLLILLLVPALSGCIRPWGPEDLRRDLSRSAGVELDREFGITIGRSGMWIARKAMKMSGEAAFVLIREENEQIRDLLVIAADREEWVLVKLKGKLDLILEDAMRMAFDEADRPDLYEKTRAERGLPQLTPAGTAEQLSPGPSD